MKTLSKFLFIAFIAVFAAFDNNNDTKGNPEFSVKLVDAPDGYDAVNVEILYMEANMGNGWVEFQIHDLGFYNLMEFYNGYTLLLIGSTPDAPCTMTELRIILGTKNTVVVDGISYELTTPSDQSSGYKIKIDPQIMEPGGMYQLVIDFDVKASVHQTGNGKYMLNPVIRGYLETAVGGIAGTIDPPVGAYYVEAVNSTDTSGTFINNVTGEFLIGTTITGTYNMTFYADPGFSDKTTGGVSVTAGNITQMGVVIIE